jgi:hypothetical protein
MQSGRQQGQQAGCVVARGAVHDDPPPGRARAEGEGEMTRWLNFGTAAFAFAAAVFWFLSASGKLPELQAYWDKTPADDPFYTALIASAKMNRIAALFSGLSALCAGVKHCGSVPDLVKNPSLSGRPRRASRLAPSADRADCCTAIR